MIICLIRCTKSYCGDQASSPVWSVRCWVGEEEVEVKAQDAHLSPSLQWWLVALFFSMIAKRIKTKKYKHRKTDLLSDMNVLGMEYDKFKLISRGTIQTHPAHVTSPPSKSGLQLFIGLSFFFKLKCNIFQEKHNVFCFYNRFFPLTSQLKQSKQPLVYSETK